MKIEIQIMDCPRCNGSCRSDDEDSHGLPCGYCQGAGEIYDIEKTVQLMPEELRKAFEEHFESPFGFGETM